MLLVVGPVKSMEEWQPAEERRWAAPALLAGVGRPHITVSEVEERQVRGGPLFMENRVESSLHGVILPRTKRSRKVSRNWRDIPQ